MIVITVLEKGSLVRIYRTDACDVGLVHTLSVQRNGLISTTTDVIYRVNGRPWCTGPIRDGGDGISFNISDLLDASVETLTDAQLPRIGGIGTPVVLPSVPLWGNSQTHGSLHQPTCLHSAHVAILTSDGVGLLTVPSAITPEYLRGAGMPLWAIYHGLQYVTAISQSEMRVLKAVDVLLGN